MALRVVLIVLDSVGIGELPDAGEYGDAGSNTLGNIAGSLGGISLPNMESLGLGSIQGVTNIKKVQNPIGSYGGCMEKSAGKDTIIGHWEISGLITSEPMPTYPEGFPDRIITEFEILIGRKVLGNKPASGTEIITEFGEEHIRTGYPIVYTSADSVFQIAAHEDIIPVDELYEMCSKARSMLTGKDGAGRVIARPFRGSPGSFVRTSDRKDFSLAPAHGTILDIIKESNYEVKAVGKIENIFCSQGITESVHTIDNMDGVDKTITYMQGEYSGLIFTNLVDFDMKFGHRNDIRGYGKALEEFDKRLPEIMCNMRENDVLVITADHGCDPTTKSTDHSREYIPVLVYGAHIKGTVDIGTRESFCDIGSTILDYLGLEKMPNGQSFLKNIIR